MIKRICVVCGKEFTAKTNRAKYCSSYCKNHSRYERSAEDLRKEQKALDEKAVKLYDSEFSTIEIANILGCSITKVYKAWNKAGLPKRLTQLQRAVKKLRDQGKCSVEIAKALGTTLGSIYRITKEIGEPFTEEEKRRSMSIANQNRVSTGNQYSKKTEKDKKAYVESFLSNSFSYVSGYKDCESMVTIRCNICGEVFERSMESIRKARRTVCPECERKRIQQKKIENEQERQKVLAERKRQQEARREQRERDRIARTRIVICEECGKPFKTLRKNQVCCSPECSRKRQNRRKDRRIAKDKYIDSNITINTLYNRDNGICWICGGKCDFDDYKVVNGTVICGNNYPSIDHVVELCNGGEHSWENVKLAHRHCNTERYWKRNAG